jgi:hypothetical protein
LSWGLRRSAGCAFGWQARANVSAAPRAISHATGGGGMARVLRVGPALPDAQGSVGDSPTGGGYAPYASRRFKSAACTTRGLARELRLREGKRTASVRLCRTHSRGGYAPRFAPPESAAFLKHYTITSHQSPVTSHQSPVTSHKITSHEANNDALLHYTARHARWAGDRCAAGGVRCAFGAVGVAGGVCGDVHDGVRVQRGGAGAA